MALNELTLQVGGMTCGNCVQHVETALRGVKGVKKVVVDLDGKSAAISAKETVTRDTLIAAVKEAGYEAS